MCGVNVCCQQRSSFINKRGNTRELWCARSNNNRGKNILIMVTPFQSCSGGCSTIMMMGIKKKWASLMRKLPRVLTVEAATGLYLFFLYSALGCSSSIQADAVTMTNVELKTCWTSTFQLLFTRGLKMRYIHMYIQYANRINSNSNRIRFKINILLVTLLYLVSGNEGVLPGHDHRE